MTNNHMRLLTEQELHDIYGGNIFTSIWNWIKKHLFVEVSYDPINGPTVSGGTSFTPDKPLISSFYN